MQNIELHKTRCDTDRVIRVEVVGLTDEGRVAVVLRVV